MGRHEREIRDYSRDVSWGIRACYSCYWILGALDCWVSGDWLLGFNIWLRSKRYSERTKMTITAQETTTLPEGAVITVMKWEQSRKNGGMVAGTTLHVHRGDKELEMRCDGVSPHNLKQYMELTVREINRRRLAMTEKPVGGSFGDKPKDMRQFVEAMAINDMFVFSALTPVIESDAPIVTLTGDSDGNVFIKQSEKPKKPKKRKRKAENGPKNANGEHPAP
jgi:hypothetical protein